MFIIEMWRVYLLLLLLQFNFGCMLLSCRVHSIRFELLAHPPKTKLPNIEQDYYSPSAKGVQFVGNGKLIPPVLVQVLPGKYVPSSYYSIMLYRMTLIDGLANETIHIFGDWVKNYFIIWAPGFGLSMSLSNLNFYV